MDSPSVTLELSAYLSFSPPFLASLHSFAHPDGCVSSSLHTLAHRQLYKDRYENFKLNMTIVFMILSLITIYFMNYW